MARPSKNGLDYFPLDCDFLSDEKVIAVKVNCGAKGIAVTLALLCAIYRQGYYAPWTDITALKIADDLPGCTPEFVGKVVEILVKYDFFDKRLFCSEKILTSASIQRRYLSATNRRKNLGELPYLIVNVCNNRVNVCNNSINVCNNPTNKSKINKTSTPVVVDAKSPPSPSQNREAPSQNREPSDLKQPPSPGRCAPRASAKPATVPGASAPAIPIDSAMATLAADDIWLDQMQVRYSLDKQALADLLPKFALHCRTRGKDGYQSIADCKSYFCNWLNINLYAPTVQNPDRPAALPTLGRRYKTPPGCGVVRDEDTPG